MTRRRWAVLGIVLVAVAANWLIFLKPLKRIFRPAPAPWTGRFQDPEGLAVDAEGNYYVADEDRGRFFMLDPQGQVVAEADALEGLPGRLTGGDSLVVLGPRHVVLIGDHVLVEIRIEGSKMKLVKVIGRRGKGEGEFEDPEGIALDRGSGETYATDEDHRRLLVFDREGRHLRTLPVEQDPESVCFFEGRLYVSMSKAGWVGCYSREGRLLFKFGQGLLEVPDCVAVSPDRKLYVTDQQAGRIQVFDLDGRFLFSIGSPGQAPGQFLDPEDLAFDPEGNLVVADGGNHRIQVLTRGGKPLRVIQ